LEARVGIEPDKGFADLGVTTAHERLFNSSGAADFESGQIWVKWRRRKPLQFAQLCAALNSLCAKSGTCDKVENRDGVMATKKTARTNASHQSSPVGKTAGAKRSGRRESWKRVLERNLVLEGLSPAEAKELVKISAA
jgi:hypothetical protein